ncbi:MAG TPA: hypothetical protein VGK32_06130 [Vicinamibacterales bacterium]|jgi:hypothetical protein
MNAVLPLLVLAGLASGTPEAGPGPAPATARRFIVVVILRQPRVNELDGALETLKGRVLAARRSAGGAAVRTEVFFYYSGHADEKSVLLGNDRLSYTTLRQDLETIPADEAAQESERLGGSFFTHYLISGMRGAADLSGDGRVTLNEVSTGESLASSREGRSTRPPVGLVAAWNWSDRPDTVIGYASRDRGGEIAFTTGWMWGRPSHRRH